MCPRAHLRLALDGHIYINARSEYHTQLAKMNFDKIFDLTAGVYFNFYNTSISPCCISNAYLCLAVCDQSMTELVSMRNQHEHVVLTKVRGKLSL